MVEGKSGAFMIDPSMVDMIPIGEIKPYKRNAKKHPQEQIDQIVNSIKAFGMNDPIGVWGKENIIVEGHGRYLALREMGESGEVPVIHLDNLTDEQRKAYALAHNKLTMNTDFDDSLLMPELEELSDIFDMADFGFDEEEAPEVRNEEPYEAITLNDKYLIPPFSVIDTVKGYFLDRKNKWLQLGIKSEIGRDAKANAQLHTFSKSTEVMSGKDIEGTIMDTGVSIFNPVICEIMYRWFCTQGGKIIDPFAGGSVRGVVAGYLGYQYTGIELRREQVDANIENLGEIKGVVIPPKWICDDSLNISDHVEDETQDFLFSCPPYFNLEKYSNDPRDISNMSLDGFDDVYSEIILRACAKLKNDRFAAVVIGDVRDDEGCYIDFHSITTKAFRKAGLKLYNEFIIKNAVGTGAMRHAQFAKTRKNIKTHQNCLVFYKGDTANIMSTFPELDLTGLDQFADSE